MKVSMLLVTCMLGVFVLISAAPMDGPTDGPMDEVTDRKCSLNILV